MSDAPDRPCALHPPPSTLAAIWCVECRAYRRNKAARLVYLDRCPHDRDALQCRECHVQVAREMRLELASLSRCEHKETSYLDAGDAHEGFVWCENCGAHRSNTPDHAWSLPLVAQAAKKLDESVFLMGADLGELLLTDEEKKRN